MMTFCFLLALGASPARAEAPLAGIPLSNLAPLGLLVPTALEDTDAWRAPLRDGPGWVLHQWSPDSARATEDVRFLLASVQRILPPVDVVGADEAWGDAGFITARRGNVTVQVRAAGAPELAAKLLAAEEAPRADRLKAEGGRDGYGRRLPTGE